MRIVVTTNKYLKEYPYSTIDVYRVLLVFGVSDPGIQHAVKKLLCAGIRGNKDYQTDLKEAIQAIERSLEMEQETVALDE